MSAGGELPIVYGDIVQSPACQMDGPGCNLWAGMFFAQVTPEDGSSPLGEMNVGAIVCRGLRRTTGTEQEYLASRPYRAPIPEQICDMVILYKPVE